MKNSFKENFWTILYLYILAPFFLVSFNIQMLAEAHEIEVNKDNSFIGMTYGLILIVMALDVLYLVKIANIFFDTIKIPNVIKRTRKAIPTFQRNQSKVKQQTA